MVDAGLGPTSRRRLGAASILSNLFAAALRHAVDSHFFSYLTITYFYYLFLIYLITTLEVLPLARIR